MHLGKVNSARTVLCWHGHVCLTKTHAHTCGFAGLHINAVVRQTFPQGFLIEAGDITNITDGELLAPSYAQRSCECGTPIFVIDILLAAAVWLVVVIEATLDSVECSALQRAADLSSK